MHAAMKLVLFDLDHTLLDGDSNHLWIEYLMAAGLAGPDAMQRQVDDHARYLAGQLDIVGYIEFQLSLLAGASVAEWRRRRGDFLASCVAPRISAAARQAVERAVLRLGHDHSNQGIRGNAKLVIVHGLLLLFSGVSIYNP